MGVGDIAQRQHAGKAADNPGELEIAEEEAPMKDTGNPGQRCRAKSTEASRGGVKGEKGWAITG